jgi:hypothetical protein
MVSHCPIGRTREVLQCLISTRFAIWSELASAISLSGNDISFENVTLQNLIGTGFRYTQGHGLLIDHVTLAPLPGRPISGTGNGSLMAGAISGDVIIRNSVFGYQGDDAFDLNTPIVRFTPTQVGNTTPMATFTFDAARPDRLQWPGSGAPAAADIIGLFDNALRFKGTAKIAAVTPPGQDGNSSRSHKAAFACRKLHILVAPQRPLRTPITTVAKGGRAH